MQANSLLNQSWSSVLSLITKFRIEFTILQSSAVHGCKVASCKVANAIFKMSFPKISVVQVFYLSSDVVDSRFTE